MANLPPDGGMPQHNGVKRRASEVGQSQQPRKKVKLLLEEDSFDQEQDPTSESDSVPTAKDQKVREIHGLTINKDFARRFEHNKQREELHRRKSTLPLFVEAIL